MRVACMGEEPCGTVFGTMLVRAIHQARLSVAIAPMPPPLPIYPCCLIRSYLLCLRLVLSRVVFAGLLAGGRDSPLALLELLGLGSLGRHDGHWVRGSVTIYDECEECCRGGGVYQE